MSEHEIFNSDEDDVLVETKPTVKIEECKAKSFFKNLFSFEFLPVALAVLSFFFTLLANFLPMVLGSAEIMAAFFFIAFGLGLAATVISLIPMVKNKKLKLNVQLVLSLVSLLLALPTLF